MPNFLPYIIIVINFARVLSVHTSTCAKLMTRLQAKQGWFTIKLSPQSHAQPFVHTILHVITATFSACTLHKPF